MTGLRELKRCAAALLACAGLLIPRAALGDGWSLQLEPGYRAGTTEITGAGGDETRTERTAFSHRYRLSLDKTILPFVTFAGSGQWEGILATTTDDERTVDSDSRRWNGTARLTLGPPILGGALSYTRRQSETSSEASGFPRLDVPALIGETYAANLSWRPTRAPTLDLILTRSENRDEDRATQDHVATEAGLSATYREIEHLDLRGSTRYASASDRVRGTESREISEAASILWDDRFLDRRVSASAGYSISRRDVRATASRADAVFLTQQLPFEGLSLVDPATALPTTVTLAPNRALVDADLAASAGLDIGPSVRLAGDDRPREVGVRFSDPTTPVNLLYVYVDRQVPFAVAAAFVWSAYASDDNVTWREIAVDRAGIRFGVFENRFEIPIARTEARYLKLVVSPLPVGVTTDPALASVFITELRTFLSEPAAEIARNSSQTGGSLTASVRALLQPSYNLAYDGGLFVRHGNGVSWSTVSGLSAGHRLGGVSSWSARVDRTDSGDSEGAHTAESRASLTLSSDPLPTLGGIFTMGTSLSETPEGLGWAATTSALARADLYTGVSLSATGSAAMADSAGDTRSRTASVSTTATVIPHRTATLNGSYALSLSRADRGEVRGDWDRNSRVEGSAAYTPFPALSLAGSISRSLEGARPATLASFSVNASPLRGGLLVLRFGYTETLDTSADLRSRQWGPGLRLTFRPGSHLDVTYSAQTTRTGALETDSRTFFANLVITLR